VSAALILPTVWAFFRPPSQPEPSPAEISRPPKRRLYVYRKYTEAILRRYVRMSMGAGRAPSLLGKELFRGKVTHYRVEAFDDVVIFVHDVDRCLEQLDDRQRCLVQRMAMEEYTVDETAADFQLNPRTILRYYGIALDRLTAHFLDVKMLQPLKKLSRGKIGG
jgi:hypothetical protein